uniref:Triactinin n=1 Tax=Sycon ciliatum TaxID=27933 RepID=A0A1T4IXY1_9METZ|nr:triactinin [Sycon ciliatum]|eukprot:scpid51450/ scgid15592/ 
MKVTVFLAMCLCLVAVGLQVNGKSLVRKQDASSDDSMSNSDSDSDSSSSDSSSGDSNSDSEDATQGDDSDDGSGSDDSEDSSDETGQAVMRAQQARAQTPAPAQLVTDTDMPMGPTDADKDAPGNDPGMQGGDVGADPPTPNF